MRFALLFSCLLVFSVGAFAKADQAPRFQLEVVDSETGRGVPLVQLSTTHHQVFVTDSAGMIAIRDPEMMGQEIHFQIKSHGYEFPADGFGYRGKSVRIEPGGEAKIEIKRVNIAERLYRVTGAGIYSDSVALGHTPPLKQPLNNALITGCDSVLMAPYRGKLYWFWGDTSRWKYPLGNFQVTGATSELPGEGGLDPEQGIDFTYFQNEGGFVKSMAEMPGDGPTWAWGLISLTDDDGQEHLIAGYEKVRGLETHRRGLIRFDDDHQAFTLVKELDKDIPLYLQGHPLRHTDGDQEYFYFGDPYPVMRVEAKVDAILDPAKYQGFTCLQPGNRHAEAEVERDDEGNVVWGWKQDTAAIDSKLQNELVKQRKLKPEERWIQLTDIESGDPVTAHRGSVAWNEYRQRWILITTEVGGRSMLGEVWYAEADAPEGPWKSARRIVTHDNYSFYNPKQHPQFAQDEGKIIYFEGTYTHTFSGNPVPTPKYDYNQMMYRLNLEDPRLREVQQ